MSGSEIDEVSLTHRDENFPPVADVTEEKLGLFWCEESGPPSTRQTFMVLLLSKLLLLPAIDRGGGRRVVSASGKSDEFFRGGIGEGLRVPRGIKGTENLGPLLKGVGPLHVQKEQEE